MSMISFPVLWLILLIIFAVAEGLTAGLVSIWFALGALAALLVALIGGGFVAQMILFAIVSAIAMAIIRPLARKYFTPTHEPTNADRNLGRTGIVIEDIDEVEGTGQVKIDGKVWTARAVDHQPIAKGTKVTVREIQGVKAMVAPEESEN